MICEDIFQNLIEAIADAYGGFEVVTQAFKPIGERYHIGELKYRFQNPPLVYARSGESKEEILYRYDGEVEQEPEFQVQYVTKEKGTITFLVYNIKGAPAFTEEAKADLKPVFNVIFMYGGRSRVVQTLRRIGYTDSLTGLLNSGGFLTYVDELMQKRELAEYNAFYFNLVKYSLVNNRFGVKEGDVIIARYANELRSFLVQGECLGRLGGDNFGALIRKERTAEFLDFISAVQTYGVLDEQQVPIVLSAVAGILEIDESLRERGRIINDGAMALNIARYVDKKPYAYASKENKEKMIRERQIAADFAEAIRKREFKAYYQPKVLLDDYSIVGAEALVRWEHDGKLMNPGEFIPVYEKNGMICTLDLYMLEQVCMDIRQWLAEGIQPVRVSVNLSRRHLTNPDVAEEIKSILKKYEMESKYIEVELTETVDQQEADLLVDFMQKMRDCGIAMSIDDFGTGYSSLNMLRSFPVDVLKVDKSFIDNLEENDRIVLSNIIHMATELKMGVIAEGVETWNQVEYLKKIQCRVVQGFLFDKPLTKDVFEKKLVLGKYEMSDSSVDN